MKNEPGYPLPDGELGGDDIVCQLVFLPDKPEYWQAFVSALHYFATWRAWERDVGKRGKDAASDWRIANELTMECWRMACLDDLQDNVAEILAIMQLGQSCCDEQDITNGDQYTDRVEDGVGDVPQNIIDAGYATGVGDWSGFDDYKCMIAHVTIDQLNAKLLELDKLVNDYGAVAGGLAAVAGILAVIFGTGGLAIVFGMVAGVGAVSLLYDALMGFPGLETLAAKVVTNHEELACSVYYADGDVNALIALNSKIDALFTVPEALVLKNMNLGPTLKSLYSGRYDTQDIAEILSDAGYDVGDFDCTCLFQIGEFYQEMPFDSGQSYSLYLSGLALHSAHYQSPSWCLQTSFGGYLSAPTNRIRSWAGYDDESGKKTWINRITFYSYNTNAAGGYARLTVTHDGGVETINNANSDDFWRESTTVFSPPLEVTSWSECIKIERIGGVTGDWFVDDIIVDFDAEESTPL